MEDALSRSRERRAADVKIVAYRRPKDGRTRRQQWQHAVQTVIEAMDAYQDWRDSLPPALEESLTAERLDATQEPRELSEQLEAAELPPGFGWD